MIKLREYQLEVINQIITSNNKRQLYVLPTGAGKSLTYQIASLLQPGLTIVVDPIKALMKDQDENLKTTAIPLSIAQQYRIIPNPLIDWELGQHRPENSDPCDHWRLLTGS